MWQILSIADVTVKESVRRKVFLGLLFFTALLIGLAISLPAIDLQAKLRLIQGWCLRTVSFFGILLAVFLSATSIPEDVEGKKLFLVLTKPITRLRTLAGKLLGFSFVLFLFFAGMGTLSALYVRWIDGSLTGEGSGLLEVRRRIEPVTFTFVHNAGAPGNANGVFSSTEPPRLWLEEAPESRFHWDFYGLVPEQMGDRIRGELTVEARSRDASFAGDGTLTIVREDTKEFHRVNLRLMWNVPARFEIPGSLVTDSGLLKVFLSPTDKKSGIGSNPTSLVLFTKPIPRGYERNFAASLLTTFGLCVMIVSLTLMGSTVVSGPVSIFLGLFFVLTGSLVEFVRGALRSVEQTIRSIHTREGLGHYHPDPSDLPLWVLEYSQYLSRIAVDVLPDLSRFDTPEMVLQGVAIPGAHVLDLMGYAGIYSVTAFLLGWLFFSMRELK